MQTTGGKLALDSFFMNQQEMDDYYGTAHLPECFLNAPPGDNPIQYFATHQQADQELQDLRTASPEKYPLERFGEYNLIVYQTNPEAIGEFTSLLL